MRLRIGALAATPAVAAFLYVYTATPGHAQEKHIAPAAAKSVTSSAAVQTPPATPQYAMVKQYCFGCHNNKVRTAGVSLEGLDTTHVSQDAATWEKVLRKLSANQMPPAGLPRPKPEDRIQFVSWLETSLDQAAAAHPNPGRPTIHRLNRAEYANAIRDLLAVDTKPLVSLPGDDSGYGFDNIGDVLSLSPVLLERYMSAANKIVTVAVGDVHMKPGEDEFFATRDTRTTKQRAKFQRPVERISSDLPFDSAGGTVINYRFPVDATYIIRIKTPTPPKADGSTNDPTVSELKIPVKAGERELGVTFLREDELPEVIVNPAALGRRGAAGGGRGGPPKMAKMDVRLDGARLKVFDVPEGQNGPGWSAVSIAGPYDVLAAGDTPSREKIFVCKPANASQDEGCAKRILSNLGRRAYRRPFTEADLKPLMGFYHSGRKDGSFDDGIEMALRAMLVSPDFLFRVEHDPASVAPGTAFRVNDYELASRLSFFLWSSIPDDELLNLAAKNRLHDPAVLQEQVSRMLADEKSDALVTNFAGQWLYLRNLALSTPDPDEFPEFDDTLRAAFLEETQMFFASILRENRPVTELLSANYSYLNDRLAEHYGIKGVYGSQFRRVLLADADRGGLLGQGAILTVTSYPNRTSVVQRGKWVLENLLGTPPPPPPPDVNTSLDPHEKQAKHLTMRQQMELHRSNPTCAACHSRMDPIGFALENYDGVGKWRTTDDGSKIDPSGKLPDGTTFQGPAGLKTLLLTKDKDEFLETFTEKLMTYALGRGLEYYDRPAMRAVIRDAESHGNTIQAYINAIVKSEQFQMRRSRES